LCRAIWESFDAMPPFIAIDQEGAASIGCRRRSAIFPRPRASARSTIRPRLPPWQRNRGGIVVGGHQSHFAPVVDVRSIPNSPIIGDRSFATEPKRVIAIAAAWAKGCATAASFPAVNTFRPWRRR